MLKRIGIATGLLLLCAISILRVARPPQPVPATAPDTAFSAERAVRYVEQIAQRPHPMGSADHDRVRDYILGQLSALGLSPQVQQTTAIGTRYREAGRVQNILARLPGTDPGQKAVLIVAHYDGVEAGPAASDDGAGSAALLETLRALRGAKVLASSIGGRDVDTTRYRDRKPDWVMQYWAVPDSGAIVGLSIPANAHIAFHLTARRTGVPGIPGVVIPPRPPYVVQSQNGDVTVVYRRQRF